MILLALPDVTVEPDVGAIVRPACCAVGELKVRDRAPALDAAIGGMEAGVRTATGPVQEETLNGVRAMYRRVGIDPTKIRPSSESLLRRVRRGDPFPRINTLVDVVNWCSLELQLPYGLYDLAAISGPITMRIGRPGDEYQGIRKDVVHLAGRLTLADSVGPFGNPTSDSWRTKVTSDTTRALVVIFVPATVSDEVSTRALALTTTRIATYC